MGNDTRLTTDVAGQSDRTDSESKSFALKHLTRMARETFGDDDKAREWLHRPTAALSGLRPLDVAAESPSGIQRVVDLLKRIDHGLSV